MVFAPTGRDTHLLTVTLRERGVHVEPCGSVEQLLQLVGEGASAAIITEEVLSLSGLDQLRNWLEQQPTWSDMPIIVLSTSGYASRATAKRAEELLVLGNITLLERPVRPETIGLAARAAIRARQRQYQMRDRENTLTLMNEDLQQFAFSVSHDLQEPIRNIAVYSELLKRRLASSLNEDNGAFLNFINTGAKRLEVLVRDLLTYTRLINSPEEAITSIEAETALAEAMGGLAEAIRSSNAQITWVPLPKVSVRPFHLQEVFQNLLSNAIKYRSPEPPRIEITVSNRNSFWQFRLKDNGIGIAPAYKDHIFGLFKRLHRNDELSGTGIGLALCKRIVERYGGAIWVESGEAAGSTFCFTLPE